MLGDSTWQRFVTVIERAKQTCKTLNINTEDHFNHTVKMVIIGSGTAREVDDIALSRYACCIIVQNGDPSKPIIAAGQTYFAIQTRRQELSDEEQFAQLNDDQKRLLLRRELANHNKKLVDASHCAGVLDQKDYAILQNTDIKAYTVVLDKEKFTSEKV